MKTSLIGSLALENGDTAWCVYGYRKMPTIEIPKENLRFFKGQSVKDMEDGNRRTLILGEDEYGAKCFIEAIINGSIKPTQNENAV